MARVRLFFHYFAAADVVEIYDRIAVFPQGFRGAYVLYTVFVPQSVGIAESRNAAIGAHPGSGKYYEFLFHAYRDFLQSIV